MNDYAVLLALSYFKQYKETYILTDLAEILGYNLTRLDLLIDELLNNEMLLFNGYLLEISNKGIMLLFNNDMNNYDYEDERIIYNTIDPTKAWNIHKPYVPHSFMKKVK